MPFFEGIFIFCRCLINPKVYIFMQFISLCSTEFLQDGKFFLFKFYNSLIMNELCFFLLKDEKNS